MVQRERACKSQVVTKIESKPTNLDRIITSNHFAIDYLNVRARMSEFAVVIAASAALPLKLSADL